MDQRVSVKYQQTVNMPQMALTGLSESWLMKEIGDFHWRMLCDNLGLKSNEIFDEAGNRLYATFVRIKFESFSSLKDFQENDVLTLAGTIQRIGNTLYYSEIALTCDSKEITCSLATTFSTRESDTDNTKLTKGVPSTGDDTGAVTVSEMPKHILDIVRIKKKSLTSIPVCNHQFDITDDVVFETTYRINPYTDINGVGLLYFAAYPLINDVCELDYFHNLIPSGSHWALDSSTTTRDVFYFANCNLDDAIIYRLNSFRKISDDRVALQSSLYRKSDGAFMARIFTIKHVAGTLPSEAQ